MAKINVLDSSVYNKISAGEVVEKPASVVKELVENSIDAGATEINVKIENGGISYIEVSDNGQGIEKDDLVKVFLPHATSKIQVASDLDCINSLGFRGEAMASIGSVAMVKLESKTQEGDSFCIECNGGEISDILPCARAKGTTTVVRNLFYNTPARLKFLRKYKAEERDIQSILEKLLFANPFIRFTFQTEDGVVFSNKGEGLLDALACVYDLKTIDSLLEINAEQYGMKMSGFISNTSFSKSSRGYQTFIVNGRVVTNTSLITALNKVYEDYFVKRTYPFAVLLITVPSSEVDVNVHPAKTEIRFEYQNKIYMFIQRNIQKCLEDSLHEKNVVFGELGGVVDKDWTMPFNKPTQQNKTEILTIQDNSNTIKITDSSPTNNQGTVAQSYEEQKMSAFKASFTAQYNFSESNNDGDSNVSFGEAKATSFMGSTLNILGQTGSNKSSIQPKNNKFLNDLVNSINNQDDSVDAQDFNESVDFNENILDNKLVNDLTIRPTQSIIENYDYRIVGQLFATYIVLEFSDYVMLIDQHAAAEYKLYQDLKQQVDNNKLELQPLLVPFRIQLDKYNVTTFENNLQDMANIGIELTKISELEYDLTVIPAILQEIDTNKLLTYLVSEDVNPELSIKERLMYKACRAAIKGNTMLDNMSINIFLNSVFKQGMHSKCPHGRPSYIKFTKKEIEKLFQRIV